MTDLIQPYMPTLWCFLIMGGMLLLQLLVADLIGLMRGHTPGTAVTATHQDVHFRATRAHANTNESIAAFVLLAVAGIALSAAPTWLNTMSWIYVGARLVHMIFYWAGFGMPRSIAFAISLVALVGLLVTSVMAALG